MITLSGGRSRRPGRILNGKRREAVLSQVLDRLRDWRLSPFEFEADARAGVRSALCLRGYAWERSDEEAAGLVAEGLRIIGAIRPTWQEGQPEFTDSGRDQDAREAMLQRTKPCARCGKLFAPVNNRPAMFCSWECVALRERACAHCGRMFAPRHKGSKYCGPKCSALAQRTVAPRTCRHCRSIFRPRNGNRTDEGFYCSMECQVAGRAYVTVVRVCEWCDTVYTARGHKSRFCSPRCRQKSIDLRNGKWRPTVITPPVFDYMIRMAA